MRANNPGPMTEREAAQTALDEFRRRWRDRERAARLDELGRRNAALFVEEQRAFTTGNQTRNDADWR
jgi:hypothetical protein